MTSSRSKWLIASVVLNVFLLGAAAGGAWRWYTVAHGAVAAGPQQRGLRFAADGLAAESRREFRRGLRDVRRNSADLVDSARSGRQDVLRLIAAPQYDRNALEAAMARTRAADLALRERVEHHVADFAATLTPKERETLADGLALRVPALGAARPAGPVPPAAQPPAAQ